MLLSSVCVCRRLSALLSKLLMKHTEGVVVKVAMATEENLALATVAEPQDDTAVPVCV